MRRPSRAGILEPSGPQRVDVLGVGVSVLDLDMAVERIRGWVDQRASRYVCVTGVHGVMESRRDPELRLIHNRSGMTTPDGMPMVWAGRYAGAQWMSRVYGPDLFAAVSALGAVKGWRFLLYGGKPGIPERVAQTLTARYPGVHVAGTISPPFRPLSAREDDEMVARINKARPDIVWVGLSTPKQERWMAEHVGRLSAPVLVGVGAAFDFVAGTVPQAPRWIQRSGFEWLFRMLAEPRRLIPRYLKANPAFVLATLRHPPRLVPEGRLL